jgi:hypothetical protein
MYSRIHQKPSRALVIFAAEQCFVFLARIPFLAPNRNEVTSPAAPAASIDGRPQDAFAEIFQRAGPDGWETHYCGDYALCRTALRSFFDLSSLGDR